MLSLTFLSNILKITIKEKNWFNKWDLKTVVNNLEIKIHEIIN